MLNTTRNNKLVSVNVGANKIKHLVPVFENITFCASCISNNETLTQIFQTVNKMGGAYSTDLSSAVNVLLLDTSVLTYDLLFQSRKYTYIVDKRADVVIMDVKVLNSIYFAWCNESLGPSFAKLGTTGTGDRDSTDQQQQQQRKEALLNMLRFKFGIKPFQLLFKKNVFIGRVDGLEEKHEVSAVKLYESLQSNINSNVFKGSGNNEHQTVIDYQRYVTSSGRNDSIFITNNIDGTRTEAAKKDGLPIIHPKWVVDCVHRGCLIDYRNYYLKNVLGLAYEDIGGASIMHCWSSLQKIAMLKEKYIKSNNGSNDLNEEMILDNSNTTVKRKDTLLWNKIMDRSINSTTNNLLFSNKPSVPLNTNTLDTQLKKKLIFENCKFYAYQFNDRHYKILYKIILKNGGVLKKYNTLMQHNNNYNLSSDDSEDDIHRNTNKTTQKRKIIIVPHNFQIDFLPDIFIKNNNPKFQLVTEFFIERCLHYNQLINIDHWCKPFFTKNLYVKKKFKILNEDNSSINLAITGFQGVELLHLMKILTLINTELPQCGLKFSKFLNKKTDLLLVNLSFFHKTIPRTNPLWYKNKYADLFEMEYQSLNYTTVKNDESNLYTSTNNTLSNNGNYNNNTTTINGSTGGNMKNENIERLHKESVKKKLEFIKTVKPIPSCTPAILFEIFEKAHLQKTNYMQTNESTNPININLNDQLWCVTCPKKTDANKNYDEFIWQVHSEKYTISESENNITNTFVNKKKELLSDLNQYNSHHGNQHQDGKPRRRSISPVKRSESWVSSLMNTNNSPIKRKREMSLGEKYNNDSTPGSPSSLSMGTSSLHKAPRLDTTNNRHDNGVGTLRSNSTDDMIEERSTQLTYGESTSVRDSIVHTEKAQKTIVRRVTRQQLKSASNL